MIAVAAGDRQHQTHIGALPVALCQGGPVAFLGRLLPRREEGGEERVPETRPFPLSAVQRDRLTWVSEAAALVASASRVAKLGVGSAGGPPSQGLFETPIGSASDMALSLPPEGVGQLVIRNPRTPFGRPIKRSEVGSFPHSESECG